MRLIGRRLAYADSPGFPANCACSRGASLWVHFQVHVRGVIDACVSHMSTESQKSDLLRPVPSWDVLFPRFECSVVTQPVCNAPASDISHLMHTRTTKRFAERNAGSSTNCVTEERGKGAFKSNMWKLTAHNLAAHRLACHYSTTAQQSTAGLSFNGRNNLSRKSLLLRPPLSWRTRAPGGFLSPFDDLRHNAPKSPQ